MKGPCRGYSELWFAISVFYLKGIKGVLFLKNATSVFFQILQSLLLFFPPQDFILIANNDSS